MPHSTGFLGLYTREIEGRSQEKPVKGTWRILNPKTTPATLRLSGADLVKGKAHARNGENPIRRCQKTSLTKPCLDQESTLSTSTRSL